MANENEPVNANDVGSEAKADAEFERLLAENVRLTDEVLKLQEEMGLLRKTKVAKTPTGDYVSFKGEHHKVIGDFRADNTFSEVKRGHCPEGVTLIAIEKQH